MLASVDRFGHFGLRLGDTARFPLCRLGDQEVYPRTWEIVAFGGQDRRHMVQCMRRHDGITVWIADYWFSAYSNPFLKAGRNRRARRFFGTGGAWNTNRRAG